MTIDNQKFLYIENSKIVNGDWVTNTLKTKVDENNNLIKSTKEEYQTNYHISDESIDNIDNNVMARRTTSSWKKHTEKFSLSKTKLTVAAVSILLIAATGIGASDAAVVALNLVSYCIDHSMNIPSYIYFKGLKCVSRSSVGKVYFRYKGKLYYDSKFKKPIVKIRKYTDKEKMEQFVKDGFIDRYSGQKLVNPGLLKVLSYYMPDVFPYHSHWKMENCHNAYWELVPTLDHIFPIALGGSDDKENWTTTSMLHNSIKSNWTLKQLNWKLYESGDFKVYDGLTSLFVQLVEADEALLNDSYIYRWYHLSIKFFDDEENQL